MSHYLYHLDEAVLTLPEGFRDASVNIFEWVEADGRCSLTIQREKRSPEVSFEQMVSIITEPYPKEFADYAEEDPMEVALDVPATSRRFRWRDSSGVNYHHQIFIDLQDSVLLVMSSGRASMKERIDEVLHETLSGMRLRERG